MWIQNIHIALCAIQSVMKSTTTKTVKLLDATNVYLQKAHGSLMNVFKEESQTMKKSELYHLAQIAVVASPGISPEHKIKIIHILAADEALAQYTEEREAKKVAEEE